jgi:hypothetical protein
MAGSGGNKHYNQECRWFRAHRAAVNQEIMARLFITVLLGAFIFASCRSTRTIQTAIGKKDTVVIAPVLTDHSKDDSIKFIEENYRALIANRINYTTFSAKIDVDYESAEGKKANVNAHVRMYRDSVIWVSITAILGIEGLRAYITKDSVKLLDKQNKVYIARSVSFLQEVTQLPLDLPTLQELIIGNPVYLDSNIIFYRRSPGIISFQSNGEFFKNLFTIGETDKLLRSSKLDDVDELQNRTCYLTYSDYENKKGVNFPTRREISVSEKKKLDIRLDFKQYEFNETLSFPFNIPKNYRYD